MSLELQSFASRVNAVASQMPAAGRFGQSKAFIFSVWALGRFEETLAEFKASLVLANKAGLVELCRADLVEAMDKGQVARSEIEHLGAVFHFVRIPGLWG